MSNSTSPTPTYAPFESNFRMNNPGLASTTASVNGLWCPARPTGNSQPSMFYVPTYPTVPITSTPGVRGPTCGYSNHSQQIPFMTYTYDNFNQLGYGEVGGTLALRGLYPQMSALFK